ncbi:hypothetical protein CGRA01v4_15057 [Colletotrichum graminicola]|uniref:Uncharacterized protein n=1 Tax=Colletotrichum graminicola (strain M1.001 / M2 / FGSC 10212) TaxID=645133 RepID=E3R073_COLGM|nr:uncharacterized protein GLRG_11656 [Colletotrichum graminicola M1.001]EFQ36511.1 hypothetical protein GLRG_11656 [Colletotrichum graminicola M1.001]WDK23765.1 hypothetical protein CGRA01v4_15057 [Colletotrichum graminicola]
MPHSLAQQPNRNTRTNNAYTRDRLLSQTWTTSHTRPPTTSAHGTTTAFRASPGLLVARSSTTPFKPIDNAWSSDSKTLTVVGEHPIVSQWNNDRSSLRNEIVAIPTSEAVEWQAIDVIRIGDARDDDMPVAVSISIMAATLSWDVGNRVAWRCQCALDEHGLKDVCCKIKESAIVNLASTPAVLKQSLDIKGAG